MSTLGYSALVSARTPRPLVLAAQAADAKSVSGVSTYVDVLAALVPAEVLTLHAAIMSVTTNLDSQSHAVTIENTTVLGWSFVGLVLVSITLYVGSRLKDKNWERNDYYRMLIPPCAFVGWTLLQRPTAIDALSLPFLGSDTRTVVALFLAVFLGFAASALTPK